MNCTLDWLRIGLLAWKTRNCYAERADLLNLLLRLISVEPPFFYYLYYSCIMCHASLQSRSCGKLAASSEIAIAMSDSYKSKTAASSHFTLCNGWMDGWMNARLNKSHGWIVSSCRRGKGEKENGECNIHIFILFAMRHDTTRTTRYSNDSTKQ